MPQEPLICELDIAAEIEINTPKGYTMKY